MNEYNYRELVKSMNDEKAACCKIGEVADRYELHDYLDDLSADWERPDGPGARTLTDKFNQAVLRLRLTRVDETPLEGEVQSLYERLKEEQSSATQES